MAQTAAVSFGGSGPTTHSPESVPAPVAGLGPARRTDSLRRRRSSTVLIKPEADVGGVPGLPKQPPDIAAAQGPTKVLPPSDETVSASNDAGATLLKDNTQSTQVKVVASEEQPVDLNALASSAAAPAPAAPAPAAPADASAGSAVKGTVDTPVVVATAAPPPPAPSQFPDPKPVRTVSLRPDGTPIPSPAVASADAGEAAPAAEAPKPAAKPTPKAATDAANAQPSSRRLDLPTKLSAKSSARVAVAKTDTTAPNLDCGSRERADSARSVREVGQGCETGEVSAGTDTRRRKRWASD